MAPDRTELAREYFLRVVGRAISYGRKRGLDLIITLAGELVAAVVAAYEGGAISFESGQFHWNPAVISFVCISALVFLYNYFRAQLEVHLEGQREVKRTENELRMLKPGRPSVWVEECAAFTLQDVRYVPNATSVQRDWLHVFLTNKYTDTITVWAPLWENSTGEVLRFSPLTSSISQSRLGYPRRDDEVEVWGEPLQSIDVGVSQTILCQIALLEPSGDGLKRRIENRNTGTMVLPVKVEGRLAVQRVKI
jgi:hypothetical protein